MHEKIVVAMSGGVDSSTTAALLQEQGHEVVGLSMQLWDYTRLVNDQPADSKKSGTCCSLDDIYDARRVASFLKMPFYVVNFEKAFEKEVVQPFVQSYLSGETPIPCVRCNTFMKFDHLLSRAFQIGAGKLATGHYARVRRNDTTGRYELLRGADESKDQSYFLFEMTQDQLSRVLFPLGEFSKSEVRKMAEDYRLPVFEKPDSQEICFIPNKNYSQFVENYLEDESAQSGDLGSAVEVSSPSNARQSAATQKGDIVLKDGTRLGQHDGIHQFTVGQRKGLGVAIGEPLYVLHTDATLHRVIVGRSDDLMRKSLVAHQLNWISIEKLNVPLQVKAQIRSRHEAADATIYPLDSGTVRVNFDSAQRAITPGQAVVFYQSNIVVGGGWIRSSE